MRIALDCMGGDHGAASVLIAAVRFVEEYKDTTLVLYGTKEELESCVHPRIEKVYCTQVMDMNDGALAIRRKSDASMVKAVQSVITENDAVVSCGSTGALLTCATLISKPLEGQERPALLGVLPSKSKKGCVFLDLGANAQNTPEHLLSFANMGVTYAKNVRMIQNPRVGLLNIGSEEKKGDELRKQTYQLLKESNLNFIGNVEANQLLNEVADVVVCDGFTGNIVLKTLEGSARLFKLTLKEQMMAHVSSKLGAMLSKKALANMKAILDEKQYGGALFAGINHVVIKAHGNSDEVAFYYALRQAYVMVQEDVVEKMKIKG